jgi:hypothetical protein
MRHSNQVKLTLVACLAAMLASAESGPPSNDLPNPYRTVTNWAQLPDARKWGSTAGVDIGPDGNIWAYDRCGANNCGGSNLDPILEFDTSGKLLRHWGAGMFVFPHGFFVDKQGNVWVTDEQASKDGTRGLQVFKLSPDGKVLLTLGKAGVKGMGPDTFGAPADVVVAPNGDIFVADGHTGCMCDNARIVKFSKDGKFIKEFGKKGTGPGEFDGPHALAFDSKGRLFVGDRTNNRIQIFDQNGKFIAEWKQFGRPSGIFITKDDTIYVTDSESNDGNGYGHNPGCHRGIRIGSAKDGKVTAYIPDPDPKGGSSMSEGVAVDRQGGVYGAEVGPKDLKKYVKN